MYVAEHIRRDVEQLGIPHSGNANLNVVTLSVGASSHIPANNVPSNQLLNEADMALYEAKMAGKNRIIASDHHL